ncbi:UBX domain-containing protein 6 [Phymastichus coffea]|uniref:UBX domain-containing protein 6 n=1 Tax=Phymastichus coffea TaxID=108790 RepID=UPI00273C30DB|nr:UBX domain-containing protein 6 [Phymastichus coffea]XP_058804959.1 UBX domain-containing protein 6 [Phymastichus coffea]
MADKIKSFFQRKIKDKKFSNAGTGHRLSESTSKASTAKSTKVPKRHEPTNDAMVAGQAALARIEKMQSAPKFNPSYTAIQARIKKELEQERLTLAKQQADGGGTSLKKSDNIPDPQPHMLAVNGVYYRCPMISEEVLDKETWYERLQEFLDIELPDEEGGLSACLIIHSCNDDVNRIKACVDTLCKYLDNIRNDPSEMKYWKIRMSNKVFKEKVKLMRGSMELLKAAGFVQEKHMHQDQEEDFLVWSPERSTIDHITTLIDALTSADSVQLQLDRNVQVLLPSQAAEKNELPKEFYVLSTEDIKREQTERSRAVERDQMLMTKAMREKFMKQKERKYRYTLIRIRFPDNIILQGTFAVLETFQAVIDFVKEHLYMDEFPFYFITATREKLTETDFEKSLEALNLVPAVVLSFFWDSDPNFETPSQSLKDDTLSLLQSM